MPSLLGLPAEFGRGIAKTLANEGTRVLVNYVRGASEAKQVVEEIRATGGKAISVAADVSKKNDADRLVDEAVIGKNTGKPDARVTRRFHRRDW